MERDHTAKLGDGVTARPDPSSPLAIPRIGEFRISHRTFVVFSVVLFVDHYLGARRELVVWGEKPTSTARVLAMVKAALATSLLGAGRVKVRSIVPNNTHPVNTFEETVCPRTVLDEGLQNNLVRNWHR